MRLVLGAIFFFFLVAGEFVVFVVGNLEGR